MERELRDLLTEAAPTVIPPVDLDDVRRRARGRRVASAATAVGALVLVALVAGPLLARLASRPDVALVSPPAAPQSEQLQMEDAVVLADFTNNGVRQKLIAFHSGADGLCVGLQVDGGTSSACNPELPDPLSASVDDGMGDRGDVVSGTVVKDATRVVVETTDGRVIEAGPIGEEAGFEANFFFALLGQGETAKFATAFDAAGDPLGTQDLGSFSPTEPAPGVQRVSNGTATVRVPGDWDVSEPAPCPGQDVPVLRLGPGLDDSCRPTPDFEPGVLMYRLSYGVDVADVVRTGRATTLVGHRVLVGRDDIGRRQWLFPDLDLMLVGPQYPETQEVARSVQRAVTVDEIEQPLAQCYAEVEANRAAVTIGVDAGADPELVCAWFWRNGDIDAGVTATPELVLCSTRALDSYTVLPGRDHRACAARGLEQFEFGEFSGDFDDSPIAEATVEGEG